MANSCRVEINRIVYGVVYMHFTEESTFLGILAHVQCIPGSFSAYERVPGFEAKIFYFKTGSHFRY